MMTEAIRNKIQKDIDEIRSGFTIVESYTDDYDGYEPLYWVTCRNDYNGYSHTVKPQRLRALRKYIKTIIEDGIVVNRERYFVMDNIEYNNLENLEVISAVSHESMYGLSKLKLDLVKQKIIEHHEELVEKFNEKIRENPSPYGYANHTPEIDDCEIMREALILTPTTSLRAFKKTMETILTGRLNYIKNVKPFVDKYY